MTTVLPRAPAKDRVGRGGLPARRAVIRWAWRLFRREWRQQFLVLALLTVAVAAMASFVSVGYNLAPPSEARFGTADQLMTIDGSDPQRLAADVAAARAWFGTIDVITHQAVQIPGSVDTVDYRGQDPTGRYGAAMLRLLDGRYPAGADEVAVTDDVAATFGLRLGDRFKLDGRDRTVVGLVENPTDLLDEFALVTPSQVSRPDTATILVSASSERFDAFRLPGGRRPAEIETRQLDERTFSAVLVLILATVGLLFVCLVAAAGFVVVAQRRLRQFGMLAAVGATEKHTRLVMLANGAAVGVIAAVVGTTVGVLGWIAAAPRLEASAAQRIDRFDLPWWAIGAGMVLAVGTATAAAWWPARSVTRTPIVNALSARPPRPSPVRRSAVLAGLLVATGTVCLALAEQKRVPLIIVGAVATALGILFSGPLAIRAAARAGRRSPIGTRIALRDLARYQARSGAALAAISLALGIAATIAISATAAEDTATEGNLAANQLLFRLGDRDESLLPVRTAAQLRDLAARVNSFAASLGNADVTALQMAVDPHVSAEPGQSGGLLSRISRSESPASGRLAIMLAKLERSGDGFSSVGAPVALYVATPAVLERLGIAASAFAATTDILTSRAGLEEYEFIGSTKDRQLDPTVQTSADLPTYTSLPTTLLNPEALRRLGWEAVPAGWLVDAPGSLTDEQIAAARDLAAQLGITVETRDKQRSLAQVRTGATIVGTLLALGVLAMTVGLIRSETAGDLRTLTATGATSRTRRTLTAATAAALALLAGVLGTLGAYAALIAWNFDQPGSLSRVPILYLAAILVGVPAAAGAGGWLLGGREPPALARRPLE